MNIQLKLATALLALAPAGGVTPNTNLDEPPVYPWIAYQFISNPPADIFGAFPRKTDFHAQITLHTLDYAGLLALRTSVLAAVEAMPEQVVRDLDIESPYEFETKSYTWILGYHFRDTEA